MKRPKEIFEEYKKLLESIPEMIQKSGFKEKYIFEKMGMKRTSFYRRKNDSSLWSLEEIEKLFEILQPPTNTDK